MKIFLIAIALLLISLLFSIKEDKAEAVFYSFIYTALIGAAQFYRWAKYKIRRYTLKRMREEHAIRRQQKKLVKTMVVLNEPLTKHQFEVTGN